MPYNWHDLSQTLLLSSLRPSPKSCHDTSPSFPDMDTFTTIFTFTTPTACEETESPVDEDSPGQRYGGYCVIVWALAGSSWYVRHKLPDEFLTFLTQSCFFIDISNLEGYLSPHLYHRISCSLRSNKLYPYYSHWRLYLIPIIMYWFQCIIFPSRFLYK